MQNKYIAFILLAFLMTGAATAQAAQIEADQTQIAVNLPREQTGVQPLMDDAALASYITGRLKQALKTEDAKVDQYCDASGCSVVVQ